MTLGLEMQLKIIIMVLKFCINIFIWMIPAMFLVNILMETGLLKKLIVPVGWFFNRFAHLPPEIAIAFISSFGSSYTAGSILVNMKEKGVLNDRQVFLSVITFSLPFHIREMFSYYLPVTLPLLGFALGSFYLIVHTTAIIVKIIFVIIMGKLTLAPIERKMPDESLEEEEQKESWPQIIKKAVNQCGSPLKKMIITIPITALVIFELNAFGVLQGLPVNAVKLGLPSCSTACLIAHMTNSLTALTSVAVCYQGGELTLLDAAKTILWGSILAAPVFFIRFSGTYYFGVYGPKLGAKLAVTSLGINILVYMAFLWGTALFF